MRYNILVAEDEEQIRDVLSKYIINAGYDVFPAKDGLEALGIFNENKIHLAVLDIMMPGIDGFEVLQNIRNVSEIPIVMLTAKAEEVDRLLGFDLGADDYVIKPFSPREVMKRVRVLIKRVYGSKDLNILKSGHLELNIEEQKLYKDNKEIIITTTEFELLKVFFNNIGRVLSREQLINNALGDDYDGFDRSVDTYIKRIRQKIEDDNKNPEYLKTKYGAGYIFGRDEYDH